MRAPRLVALLAAAATLAGGCVSRDEGRAPEPLAAVQIADVRELVAAGKGAQALEAVDRLGRSGDSPAEELEALRREAVASLAREGGEAIAEGAVDRARRAASSLRAAGERLEAAGREWGEADLLREAARRALTAGPRVLAAHWGFRLAALAGAGNVDASDRARFVELLGELRDPAAREQAWALLAAAGASPAGPPPAAARSLPLTDAVRGTVTVLVDRGLRVVNRVGTPDRVLGSGFAVDPSGYYMTNYHVIASEVDPEYEGFSRLYVMRTDRPNERIPAKVVGWDRLLDLAVIKAEVESEYTLYPGLAAELRQGDQVLAIGSPASLESSVNSGIVSAVGRRFLQLGDVVQIDVPVNPGNSGGPLLDAERRVVGVVFAGLEQFEGLNFAIPSRWVGAVFPRLFSAGQVRYAWLGAAVTRTDAGLEVLYAVPGGPAERAGLQEGDLLRSVGGVVAREIADVQGRLMEHEPPALVEVLWRRGEADHRALVCLDERPLSPVESALERDLKDRLLLPLFGMKLERIGQTLGKGRYVVRRVLPGSQAAEIGLTANDPLSIDAWRVDTEQRVAILSVHVTRKSSGYLEGMVQLAAYLEQDTFL